MKQKLILFIIALCIGVPAGEWAVNSDKYDWKAVFFAIVFATFGWCWGWYDRGNSKGNK